MPTKDRVLVAMSGGVDSSAAALLLKNKGMECFGVTMRLYDGSCGCDNVEQNSRDNITDARDVCEKLGIDFTVCDFRKQFKEYVTDRFIKAYLDGETPNPCIDCNRNIKFNLLMQTADKMGMRYLASGHYARIECAEGKYYLKKAADETKDQSYVLYMLGQEQLKRILFPLGGMRKKDVREIAETFGFINANRADSQDICFIKGMDYASAIKQSADLFGYECELPGKGDFLDVNGKVIGSHEGHYKYTIGQRKGLRTAFGKPMYVMSKNAESNTVTLCEETYLYTKRLTATCFNWITDMPKATIRVKARIRYNQKEQCASATVTDNGKTLIVFDTPQRAVTRGQAVVLYDGDIVMGGGTIE